MLAILPSFPKLATFYVDNPACQSTFLEEFEERQAHFRPEGESNPPWSPLLMRLAHRRLSPLPPDRQNVYLYQGVGGKGRRL